MIPNSGASGINAALDIGNNVGSGLMIRNGDYNHALTSKRQVLLGYNGTNQYCHSINTRHDGGGGVANAIDLMLWNNNVDPNTVGNICGMSIAPSGVGIGTVTPAYPLDVAGTTRARGLGCAALFTSIYQYIAYTTNGSTTFQMTFSAAGSATFGPGVSLVNSVCSTDTNSQLSIRCNYILSIVGWNGQPTSGTNATGINVTYIIFICMLEGNMTPLLTQAFANKWNGYNANNQGEVYLGLAAGGFIINFNPAGTTGGNVGADNNIHYFNVNLMRIG